MGQHHSATEVPGYKGVDFYQTDIEKLKSNLKTYEKARSTKLTARILLANKTKYLEIGKVAADCSWGLFFSKYEDAFGKDGMIHPGKCGGIIASKKRDLLEGTEGYINLMVKTHLGYAKV